MLASGGVVTGLQESWASSPSVTETCLFRAASHTDAGTRRASYPVISRAKATKGMAATRGLIYLNGRSLRAAV